MPKKETKKGTNGANFKIFSENSVRDESRIKILQFAPPFDASRTTSPNKRLL
jgi:hypothetical protein